MHSDGKKRCSFLALLFADGDLRRHLAEERSVGGMILPTFLFEVPSARRVRTRRSIETAGSPASILATLNWLDFTSLASHRSVGTNDVPTLLTQDIESFQE